MIYINEVAQKVYMAAAPMTQGEKIELQWFQPWHLIIYCFIIFAIMVWYYQYKWAKTCKNNILVLVSRSDGDSYSQLVPKSSGAINLTDKETGELKTWPINRLSTINVNYPGVGFVPQFLQKKIMMTIVDEEDWEPMINRDPNKQLIASPAVLANLIHQQFTAMMMTITKDTMDRLAVLIAKMERVLDKQTFYIGIGLVVIGIIAVIAIMMANQPDIDGIEKDIKLMKQSMGIVEVVPTPDAGVTP